MTQIINTFNRAVAVFILALLAAWPAAAEQVLLIANMDAAQAVPASGVSGAKGRAVFAYDSNTNMLIWNVISDGLSSRVIGVRIHGPAGPGQVGDVLFKLGDGWLASPIVNDTVVTPELAELILSGNVYVNLQTENNASGEIRGQLVKQ